MKKLLLTMLLLLFSVLPVRAAEVGGMFGQGRTQFSLGAGSAYAFDSSYFVISASASYYVLAGLGVGMAFEGWSGSGPGISKYSPFAQFVFYQMTPIQPYVGGFYRHTTIAGLPGINSVGARTGILMSTGSNVSLGFGIVHEAYLDCQTSIYRTCSDTYPDIAITFAF